jgi:hypothetical protein
VITTLASSESGPTSQDRRHLGAHRPLRRAGVRGQRPVTPSLVVLPIDSPSSLVLENPLSAICISRLLTGVHLERVVRGSPVGVSVRPLCTRMRRPQPPVPARAAPPRAEDYHRGAGTPCSVWEAVEERIRTDIRPTADPRLARTNQMRAKLFKNLAHEQQIALFLTSLRPRCARLPRSTGVDYQHGRFSACSGARRARGSCHAATLGAVPS